MREFEYYLYENFDADQESGNTSNPRNFLGKETDTILSLIAQQSVNTYTFNNCCDKFGTDLICKLIDGDTQEAIISKEQWNRAQELRQ